MIPKIICHIMSSVDGLFGVPSIFEYMGGMTEYPAK